MKMRTDSLLTQQQITDLILIQFAFGLLELILLAQLVNI